MENPLRQNLFRGGHAHAGVLLVLSLVALRFVDEAELPGGWKWVVRSFIPSAAIFLPAAFFFSVLSPSATQPNAFIYLAFVGALALAIGWSRSASVCCAEDEWLTHLELSFRTKAGPQRAPLLRVLGRK